MLADEHDRGLAAGDDVGGGATDEAIIDPAVAVGAEYDEVAPDFLGFFEDASGGCANGRDSGGGAVVGAGQAVGFKDVFLCQREVSLTFGYGENDERKVKGICQFGGYMKGA